MSLSFVRQDITKMAVDAIVNAANTGLQEGSGVCGAIFTAAGPAEMTKACQKLAPIHTGEAVITPGFALPAKFVIHTAGPVYRADNPAESERLLRSAYTKSLQLAVDNNCASIAFPLISSGIFGYPKAEALSVATSAIREFLNDHELEVYLVVFDKKAFVLSEAMLSEVQSYIDENYVGHHTAARRRLLNVEEKALRDAARDYECGTVRMEDFIQSSKEAPQAKKKKPTKIEPQLIVANEALSPKGAGQFEPDEPFNAYLLKLIASLGKKDSDVYNKANLDRKLFSKIRTGKHYMPSKRTVLALAIGMELNLEETEKLLKRAGFAFSPSLKFDLIVKYFIENRKYDIYEINECLFEFDQPLLGLND